MKKSTEKKSPTKEISAKKPNNRPDYIQPPHLSRTSDKQVTDAIKGSWGNLSEAARKLGVSRTAIFKRVDGNAKLKQILSDVEESKLDLAESKLLMALDKNEPWAIKFMLVTKGKTRGYVERTETTGAGGSNLAIPEIRVNFIKNEEIINIESTERPESDYRTGIPERAGETEEG